jgi:hypothetical protein
MLLLERSALEWDTLWGFKSVFPIKRDPFQAGLEYRFPASPNSCLNK